MEIYRGDTFNFDFTATFEDGKVYEFVPNEIIKIGIKRDTTSSKYTFSKEIKIEEETKVLKITIPHEETKKFGTGKHLLEVELTDTTGKVITLCQENLNILGDVINE